MYTMVTIAASIWVLSAARGVLQPIAIAALILFLLSATARFYRRFLPESWAFSGRLAGVGSAATFGLAIVVLGTMITDNVNQLRLNLPTYEANVDRAWTGKPALCDSDGAGYRLVIGLGECCRNRCRVYQCPDHYFLLHAVYFH